WQEADEASEHMFPILECLSSVCAAVGLHIHRYAEQIVRKSYCLLHNSIHRHLAEPNEITCSDMIVCALDVISALTEGLGPMNFPVLVDGIIFDGKPLSSFLHDAVMHCLNDIHSDVKQSAFSLVGELC